MSANDASVQLPPEGSGKKVDTSELTRDDGTVVERQRMVLSGDGSYNEHALAEVKGRKLQVSDESAAVLQSIDEKLGRICFILETVFSPI